MPAIAAQRDEEEATTLSEQHGRHLRLTPTEQQERIWKDLRQGSSCQASTVPPVGPTTTTSTSIARRTWPSYDEVLGHMGEADYTETLTCPFDTLSSAGSTGRGSKSKTLCPHGVVCCAELEIFPGTPYSGLLEGNQRVPCILRLSSAMKPPALGVQSKLGRAVLYATGEKIRKAKLFPCAALKVFRQGVPSGNLLFGGSKVGQREHDFFAHCLCTSMTEQMPRAMKPFVRKFWTYSDYPLSLGVSDFCGHSSDGNTVTDADLSFPFAIVLRPCRDVSRTAANEHTRSHCDDTFENCFDEFLDNAHHIPCGTVLYDLFACPEPRDVPDSSKLQRIGRIATSSAMIQSSARDGLFFRHQRKEEDYALRPEWRHALSAEVTINQGQTQGTIGQLAGWKLFEQHIEEGLYVDFEQPQS